MSLDLDDGAADVRAAFEQLVAAGPAAPSSLTALAAGRGARRRRGLVTVAAAAAAAVAVTGGAVVSTAALRSPDPTAAIAGPTPSPSPRGREQPPAPVLPDRNGAALVSGCSAAAGVSHQYLVQNHVDNGGSYGSLLVDAPLHARASLLYCDYRDFTGPYRILTGHETGSPDRPAADPVTIDLSAIDPPGAGDPRRWMVAGEVSEQVEFVQVRAGSRVVAAVVHSDTFLARGLLNAHEPPPELIIRSYDAQGRLLAENRLIS
ncbi:MAG TPA: hypothetical protein VGP36_04185 [Mycobacteriales bacterium]|jgi:hypothetical protein|nr:hypothetical protein [Mycobacteriales bacterium]